MDDTFVPASRLLEATKLGRLERRALRRTLTMLPTSFSRIFALLATKLSDDFLLIFVQIPDDFY
jgi:hypothetical protein